MGSIRTLAPAGKLFVDFRYLGKRCREYTSLDDTGANRKKLQKLLDQIELEISAGTFDYQRYFPNSKRAVKFAPEQGSSTEATPVATAVAQAFPATNQTSPSATPTFSEFAETWYAESEVSWRKSHQRTIRDILDKRLIPEFGEKVVGQITKADIMAFRSTLAKVPGRKSSTLKAKSINAIMTPLRQILNEAADRFEFNTPFRNIKPLRIQKSDVEPFTLDEVQQILDNVRADFRNYYTVRFFTGMRTGEIDGLKWKYVDFTKRMMLVRESIVAGEQDYTKTDGSQREIQMSGLVYDALKAQAKVSQGKSEYVFCTRSGERRICPGDRFNELYQRYGYLAKQFTVFGQHVHVGCTSADDAIWLTQALGVYVPAFIALSASSPFVDGVDSFYQSARLNAVSAFPLSGQCPPLGSWQEFTEHFAFLQACGIAQGIKDLYWDVRPKPEFGTVEIRVCDTPLTIEQATSLAALAQSLARWLLRTRPPLHTDKQAHVARYNKFQACRYGLEAMISDPVNLCQTPLKQTLADLLEAVSEDARELDCAHWLSPLKQAVAENTGDAAWLRAREKQHGNLNDVVRQASERLMGNND